MSTHAGQPCTSKLGLSETFESTWMSETSQKALNCHEPLLGADHFSRRMEWCGGMDVSSGDDEPESHWALELSRNNNTILEQTVHVTAPLSKASPLSKAAASTAASSAYFMPLEKTHEGDFDSDAEDTFEQHFKVN